MRRLLRTATAAVFVALLVGCTGSGSDSGSADGGAGEGVGAPQPAVPGDLGGAPGVDTDEERQVVTTASASLAVEDPADAAQRVSELVESAGGRVDERTEQAGSGKDALDGATADLVVRVPADALTGLLADLEDLGDVETVSVSRSDVTATAVDLDARIEALQTSVDRLLGLMDEAADTEALLAAERALSERQAELESLQSQRALLADQVELSTLSVHLGTFGVAPAGGPDGFLDGFGTGWRALVTAGSAVVITVGVLLPWLAVAAVLTAAVLVPIRLSRRRAAVAAPAAAGPPMPGAQGPPAPSGPPPQE
jgi:Domain of unknown function (DUF4349)